MALVNGGFLHYMDMKKFFKNLLRRNRWSDFEIPCLLTDQNFKNNSEKGHSILCLLKDQNFKNNSEKGHSRNISMRLFQNLTNSFREDFL